MDKDNLYMDRYLRPTSFFDAEHPAVQELVNEFRGLPTSRAQIEGLYRKVRDGWRYNPYIIGLRREHFRASFVAGRDHGHCIDKSILMVAGFRALGIPARIRLAKVSNHIAAERLLERMGTQELAPHGLVEVFHEERWVKCSPAFNSELCALYGVDPLDFDGTADSVLQEYNRDSRRFMEYLEDYGPFDDLPFALILRTFRDNYPDIFARHRGADFVRI